MAEKEVNFHIRVLFLLRMDSFCIPFPLFGQFSSTLANFYCFVTQAAHGIDAEIC